MLTDQKIENDIKYMLEISQKSELLLEQQLAAADNKLGDAVKVDYHEHVADFKKKSQTSITLRVALATRKVILSTFKLQVPESFIKKQILSLNSQEQECLKIIKNDMSSLQQDVDALMTREDCPELIKSQLVEISSELQANAEHINSGKDIVNMPMVFESIELSGELQAIKEIEDLVEHPNDNGSNSNDDTKSFEDNQAKTAKKKISFLSHLSQWINSSWKKNWKDIK